jgi:hypothetical protein
MSDVLEPPDQERGPKQPAAAPEGGPSKWRSVLSIALVAVPLVSLLLALSVLVGSKTFIAVAAGLLGAIGVYLGALKASTRQANAGARDTTEDETRQLRAASSAHRKIPAGLGVGGDRPTHPREQWVASQDAGGPLPVVVWTAVALVICLILVIGGWALAFRGDDEKHSGGIGPIGQPPATVGASDPVNLAGVCPNPIVVQTDWDPEAEYGVYYHLLGPDPRIDTQRKRVSGPLVVAGKDTGVQIEVRTGGPSIGFEPVSSQMYKDPSITVGQVSTDEAIRFSAKQATQAVVAPMEFSPFMIMWDPQTYPQFNTIADIGKTDTTVLYFEGDTYMEYLIGAGVLKRSQVDGSYDGKPGNFVAADGQVAQAGFATSEPYIYEHEVRQWNKPVRYALVSEAGYPFYPQALSIRAADKQKLAPCLEKLVPIVQRAQVDYLNNPAKTNELILQLVNEYNTGWVYSAGLANYAITKMRETFISNGPDETLGNFDQARVQRMIEITTPIFTAQRQPPKQGLKPEDIATNEFVDTSIGVGS